MDASLWVALLDLLWLVMLAFAWLKDKQNHIRIHEAQRKWLENLSERLSGLEGRIEDAQKTHEQDAVIVNGWAEEIEALKLKQETFEHRTLGWQEGFGGEVRKQLKRMDERIAKLEVKGE